MSWRSSQNQNLVVKNLTVTNDLDMSGNSLENIASITGYEGTLDVSAVLHVSTGIYVDSDSIPNGSITTVGGITAYGNIISNETMVANSTNDATGPETGAIYTAGGGSFGKNLYVGGDLILNGSIQSSSQTSSATTFECKYAFVSGNADYVDIPITLTENTTGTSNNAVFPSIFDGYSGSGGTYNPEGLSGAMNQLIIRQITSEGFICSFTKATGNNVNMYVTF